MDIGDADIEVDESVELMDPSALSDKMVLMPVGEAGQNQEDISESCHADFCFYVQFLFENTGTASQICWFLLHHEGIWILD